MCSSDLDLAGYAAVGKYKHRFLIFVCLRVGFDTGVVLYWFSEGEVSARIACSSGVVSGVASLAQRSNMAQSFIRRMSKIRWRVCQVFTAFGVN